MSPLKLAAALLALAAAPALASHDDPKPNELIDRLLDEMERCQGPQPPSPAQLSAWRSQLLRLKLLVEPPPQPAPPVEMSAIAFADFTERLKKRSFTEDKVAFLDDFARDAWFRVDQVMEVLQLLHFSRRVEVAALLYPRVLDGYNWYRVYDTFTYTSDRNWLRHLIGRRPLR